MGLWELRTEPLAWSLRGLGPILCSDTSQGLKEEGQGMALRALGTSEAQECWTNPPVLPAMKMCSQRPARGTSRHYDFYYAKGNFDASGHIGVLFI